MINLLCCQKNTAHAHQKKVMFSFFAIAKRCVNFLKNGLVLFHLRRKHGYFCIFDPTKVGVFFFQVIIGAICGKMTSYFEVSVNLVGFSPFKSKKTLGVFMGLKIPKIGFNYLVEIVLSLT